MAKYGPPQREPIDRFMEKIAHVESGCIEWTASTDGKGYGKFQWERGRNGRLMPAHRWFYEWKVGPVSPEMHLDHLCRNRLCVNPEHLEPVTHQENILRGVGPAAVNAKKTQCIHGHPFNDVNTYITVDGRRNCRACSREHDRKRRPSKARKAA